MSTKYIPSRFFSVCCVNSAAMNFFSYSKALLQSFRPSMHTFQTRTHDSNMANDYKHIRISSNIQIVQSFIIFPGKKVQFNEHVDLKHHFTLVTGGVSPLQVELRAPTYTDRRGPRPTWISTFTPFYSHHADALKISRAESISHLNEQLLGKWYMLLNTMLQGYGNGSTLRLQHVYTTSNRG